MKKIIIILLFIVSNYSIAQSPVLNIHTTYQDIENAYYKDIDNFQNQFVGTWVYTDGTKTIRFRFIKKEMFYFQSVKSYYIDVLLGEMQYIENGVEKINSLMNLNVNHPKIFDYSLHGSIKIAQNYPPLCGECPQNVERLSMSYDEPSNDDVSLDAYFVMRRVDENGVQKIKIQYMLKSGPLGVQSDFETPSTTTDFIIPYGDYTLTKEN
jgi:hypothetical protein